jgi:polyhydroxybutyrate depolymerase
LPDIANDGTTITETKYINGTNGSEVISYVILNGGHTWPHGNPGLPVSIVGKVSKDMNGVEVAWAFFKRFHR